MRVVGIEHVQLAMPTGGEVEAQAFYEGLLGLPWVPKPPHLEARGGCWFESESCTGAVTDGPTAADSQVSSVRPPRPTNGVKIHLGVEEPFIPARKAHPALLVDGLASLVERLLAAGVMVREDEPLEGYHRVYVDDPFGNRLELMEPQA